MTLTILLILIPAIASITGLIGKSWDDSKASKIKLTLRGWTSLIIILTGLSLTAFKAIQTQIENDNLKDQKHKVRSLVYDKIYYDCIAATLPIRTIYLEKSNKIVNSKNIHILCEEMSQNDAQDIFRGANLLESVKSGTALEEWDKSYADYLRGYYNSKYPYNLENTMTKWANYIDMEDLLIIDKIVNHGYLLSLQNISYGNNEGQKNEFRSKVGFFNYFDNEDLLKEQSDFLLNVSILMKKSVAYTK